MGNYPTKRGLDSICFRVARNGTWCNVCFSDLSRDEQLEVMEGRSEGWLRDLGLTLAWHLHKVGDDLDVKASDCEVV